MTARDVVYVATGDDQRVEEALLAAASAKRQAPGRRITLFTDRPRHALCGASCFDAVETIASEDEFKGTSPEQIHIVRPTRSSVETKLALLDLAQDWASAGRNDAAQQLYDYVAALPAPHQLRAFWPLALSGPSQSAGEEWATAALKRADVHITYGQTRHATTLFDRQTEASLQPQVLAGLARIALANRNAADAAALAGRAFAMAPGSSYAAAVFGTALVAAGRPRDAIAPLTKAATAGRAGVFALLGQAWFMLEDYTKAAEAFTKAVAFDPTDTLPSNNLMPALLGARAYTDVVRHADAVLAAGARDTSALAFKSVALCELGARDELASLVDYDRLIARQQLAPPVNYQSIAAFNSALASEILAEPSLAYERNTTRLGYQTGDLAQSTAPAIRALNAIALAAARARADSAGPHAAHPFDRAAPRAFSIYSWAVVMNEDGHQDPHFHPNGWLSGVYYIEVPGDIAEHDPNRFGWIEFGRSESRWHRDPAAVPTHQVFPKGGLLITFPSYFWHSTRSLKSTKRRISFAFDIIPT